MTDYSIRWCPVERLDELQRFIDEHWRRGHVLARDDELLRWQHRSLRDRDRLAVLLAEARGELIAMLGFVEFDACVSGERVPGGWMTNWLVLPEQRGRSLGLALVEHVLGSYYGFVGALAANAATRRILGRQGFAEVSMLRWVRVFDVEGLRRLLGRRDYVYDAWAAPPGPVETRESPADGFVGACRDARFLRWRYEKHPRFRYEVARDDGGFAAWRVESVRDSDATVMRILDFTGGSRLAANVATAAERAGVVFADFSCTSARFGTPLERAGFRREDVLGAELPGRFQPLDLSDRPVVSCFWPPTIAGDDLYVTRGDSDLDRPN